jgi:hypothetical protein
MCEWIEFADVRQIPGEPRRRWFTGEDLDLLVWFDESDRPIGFQLCYKNGGSECALTWNPDRGLSHKIVDDGEQRPGKHKASPILVAGAPASASLIRERFAQVSAGLPVEIAEFVSKKLREGAEGVTEKQQVNAPNERRPEKVDSRQDAKLQR